MDQAIELVQSISGWVFGHNNNNDNHAATAQADTHATPRTPTEAASYVASFVSSFWNSYMHNKNEVTDIIAGDALPVVSSLYASSDYSSSSSSSDTLPPVHSFWERHHWLRNPSAALDSFLWNFTPDIRSLQARYGLGETFMDIRIIALAILLPLFFILVLTALSMGAGHTDENNHPNLHRPTKLGVVDTSGSSSSRGGGNSRKKKKLRAQESLRGKKSKSSIGGETNLIEGNTLGSWMAHLGSSGFYGSEQLAYAPFDIIAAMKELENEKPTDTIDHHSDERRNSWSAMMGAIGYAGGEQHETHTPYKHLEDESVAGKVVEELVGPSVVQHEQDELALDNQDLEKINETDLDNEELERLQREEEKEMAAQLLQYEQKSMATSSSAKVAKEENPVVQQHSAGTMETDTELAKDTSSYPKNLQMPGSFHTGQKTKKKNGNPSGDSDAVDTKLPATSSKQTPKTAFQVPLRTRTPRADSTRDKKASAAAAAAAPTTTEEGNLLSKLWGFASSNPFLKNVDSMSGGRLGTAATTVASLANTAEAKASTLVKEKMPSKISDFAEDLRESFDYYAMKSRMDKDNADNENSWGLRRAVNHIKNMHDTQGGLSFSVEDISAGPKTRPADRAVDDDTVSELSDDEVPVNDALMTHQSETGQVEEEKKKHVDDHSTKKRNKNKNKNKLKKSTAAAASGITVHPHDEDMPAGRHVKETQQQQQQQQQQFTVDEETGDKVAAPDTRRDSGYVL
ncbi:hypothetical protein BG004_001514 [Podila humilis]|nr:hypothetical protein BG004_001514 [Podila humilis]